MSSSAMHLLVKEKNGLSRVQYSHVGVADGAHPICPNPPLRAEYNRTDGSILAYTTASEVIVMNCAPDGSETELCRLPMEALDISLSPSGRHLSTFCSPPMPNLATGEPAANTPNLHVWRLPKRAGEPAQLIASFLHRHQNSWHIQWTSEENFFARLVQNEVRFYRGDDKVAFKIQEDNLCAFSISPGAYPKAAIFVKEAKSGEPAAIKIFLLPSTQKPIASKLFFKADKIEFMWSPTGKHLLGTTHTDVDSTGQSYYGENNLYFMSGDGSFDCRVALEKSGPIHDVAWGPRGDEFVVCYGYMPNRVTLFNLKCEAAFEFPIESKNHVRYSSVGNLICFGGFGNLPGYVEIWTRSGTTLRRVGHLHAPSASICEWSPSGHCLITATVTPRLRVDNCYKIWSWTGQLLEQKEFKELYQLTWRPVSDLSVFPLVDFSKAALSAANIEAAAAPPKKEAYVPPALRNRPGASGSPGLKASPTSQPASNGKTPTAGAAVAVQLASISSGLSNREKNIRKLKQKLDAIRELKAKLQDGAKLELNQLDKIKSEPEVEKELLAVMAQPDV